MAAFHDINLPQYQSSQELRRAKWIVSLALKFCDPVATMYTDAEVNGLSLAIKHKYGEILWQPGDTFIQT